MDEKDRYIIKRTIELRGMAINEGITEEEEIRAFIKGYLMGSNDAMKESIEIFENVMGGIIEKEKEVV